MNAQDFVKFVVDAGERRLFLCGHKSHDYATEDVLSNFKRMAEVCKMFKVDVTKPEGCAMFLVLLKLDRICNLVFGDIKPENESVIDSEDDCHNYLDLFGAIRSEYR